MSTKPPLRSNSASHEARNDGTFRLAQLDLQGDGEQHSRAEAIKISRPRKSESCLKRDNHFSGKKLTFLKEVNVLCNGYLGLDYITGTVLEHLRVFYNAKCCLMVCVNAIDGSFCSRRVDDIDPLGATRESPMPPTLANLLLVLPFTIATTHRASKNALHVSMLQRYEVLTGQKFALPIPVNAQVSGFFEGQSFVCVPLVHQARGLGRLFLTSDKRYFDGNDIEFIYQALSHLTPLMKEREMVDRLSRNVAEQERLRIARDIHDSLVQPFIGLQMGIESLRRRASLGETDLMPQIEHLGEMCRNGTLELRSYTQKLQKTYDREEGWLAAIHRLGALFQCATGIGVRIEADSETKLPDRLAVAISQMVAEALSNIRRHAQAEEAIIHLACRQKWLFLSIENRGSFANSAESSTDSSRSFTPVSLSERTWSLGGSIRVETQPHGATVIMEIPLEDQNCSA